MSVSLLDATLSPNLLHPCPLRIAPCELCSPGRTLPRSLAQTRMTRIATSATVTRKRRRIHPGGAGEWVIYLASQHHSPRNIDDGWWYLFRLCCCRCCCRWCCCCCCSRCCGVRDSLQASPSRIINRFPLVCFNRCMWFLTCFNYICK